MNAQDINKRIGDIMLAMDRDQQGQPRFSTDAEMKAYKAQSIAIEQASKAALAELIGETLSTFNAIGQSLAIIAENTRKAEKTLLSNGSHAKAPVRMPSLDK